MNTLALRQQVKPRGLQPDLLAIPYEPIGAVGSATWDDRDDQEHPLPVRTSLLAQVARFGGGQGESRQLATQCRLALQGRHFPVATVNCLVALSLAAAVLWGGATLLQAIRLATAGTVYSVAAVQEGLARQPVAWVGRTVRVRGMVLLSGCLSLDAGGSTPCHDRSAYLLDRDGASLLPVAEEKTDPLLAALRRLPLGDRLVPEPQVVRWGALATYRARLLRGPATACSAAPCYEAVLQDAAP